MSLHSIVIGIYRQTGGNAIVVTSLCKVGENEGEGELLSLLHCCTVFTFVGKQKGMYTIVVVKWKKMKGRVCCHCHIIM